MSLRKQHKAGGLLIIHKFTSSILSMIYLMLPMPLN